MVVERQRNDRRREENGRFDGASQRTGASRLQEQQTRTHRHSESSCGSWRGGDASGETSREGMHGQTYPNELAAGLREDSDDWDATEDSEHGESYDAGSAR